MANSKSPNNIKTSDAVREAAMEEASAVFQRLGTSRSGMNDAQADLTKGHARAWLVRAVLQRKPRSVAWCERAMASP